MDANNVIEMLKKLHAHAALDGNEISLRCDCDNFETVYVVVDSDRGLVATDRGETFGHLARGTDRAFVRFETLNVSTLAQLCQAHGATLRERVDQLPCIEIVLGGTASVGPAVSMVASAIDAVFEASLASGQ